MLLGKYEVILDGAFLMGGVLIVTDRDSLGRAGWIYSPFFSFLEQKRKINITIPQGKNTQDKLDRASYTKKLLPGPWASIPAEIWLSYTVNVIWAGRVTIF